ncbi:hypothetical protein GCM10023321_80070 [Pseudonocardia eucalypti]|uniref:DUF4178 domain-containing protein n=1 Tax=Pseudonocardia eucalypti TaxID=648755 RepID=A0ABP9RDD6_9PSEU|nr:hypothetical protein [Pseudonocardia eucalypti]
MRLVSGSAFVDLRPVGYQYSSVSGGWDGNWLLVRGEVGLDDGRSWSFTDPCLTTWEARSLGEWLRAVADGDVPVTDGEPFGFTEPNLALSLAERSDDRYTVRIHLALGSCPPWPVEAPYFLPLRLGRDELRRGADHWVRESAAFPPR